MPDIGLLGGPPRMRIVPPPLAAAAPLTAAAPLEAPIDEAPLAVVHSPVVSVAPVTLSPLVVAVAISPPVNPAAPASRGPRDGAALPPVLAHGAPPPICWTDLLWIGLALLLIIGTGIGIRDPWPADEPRFAVVARDMVASGEWLFPRVGGDLYQDKPPFFFWLLAIGYTLTGSLKWSFLLPAFAAAGGVLTLIYDMGRRLVGREAGLAAALTTCFTLQFLMVFRGAQIDPVLCGLTTLSLYALLRHLLSGPAWGWYTLGGFVAGVGVFTKGVGFLPVLLLIPFFIMRGFKWNGLATIDAGPGGWRWWLAPVAMLFAISLWFVPMLVAVANSGSPEYIAYRDEILFKQTVGRYAASWHHVKAWYYFILEVIPPLWLPFSLLLFWLVPKFKAAWHARDARVWLPLAWVFLVVLFFSISPGKRGVYITPALPAFAIASLSFLPGVLARPGVRRASLILGSLFFVAAAAFVIAVGTGAKFAVDALAAANLDSAAPLYVFLALCGAGLVYAFVRAPLAGWPVALGSLALVFSYGIAPRMNGNNSGADFTRSVMSQLAVGDQLAFVAYKEQFLLYVDRPTMNFGHRRVFEGPQESYDASAWLNEVDAMNFTRVLLVPADQLKPCFAESNTRLAGRTSDEDWYLVRPPAAASCAEKGDSARAIRYALKGLHD